MYKKFLTGLVWVCLCAGLSAQEAKPRFFTGGGISAAARFTGGGHGEFGFLMYHGDRGLDIRNHVLLRGGGGDTDIFLTEKTSIYFETGWLGQLTSDGLLHGTLIQIGWRGWF
ncbi:MAG: hypothetical protein LBT95_03455 [Treponema sp.]|jgi:hypothetical protein|nr:hypothetical protein [Treponema sp.]